MVEFSSRIDEDEKISGKVGMYECKLVSMEGKIRRIVSTLLLKSE